MPYAVAPLPTRQHRFATGITIHFRPISSWQRIQLAQRATRSLRSVAPTPPTYQDDFGGPATPNYRDEGYLAALAAHQQRIAIRTFQWAAQMALVVDAPTVAAGLAAHQAEADALAAFLAELPPEDDGAPELSELDRFLDGASDTVRWVLLVATGGDTMALVEWMGALYGGGVDAEAVADATEMFPRDVSGDVGLEPEPAAVGPADRNTRADLDPGGGVGERDTEQLSRAAE